MKILLLCLGFYLTIFSNAKAQDSSNIAKEDTIVRSDSSGMPDSLSKKNLRNPVDTLKKLQKDSLSVIPSTSNNTQDTATDIFDEMRDASRQQDLSMKADDEKSGDLTEQPKDTGSPANHPGSVAAISSATDTTIGSLDTKTQNAGTNTDSDNHLQRGAITDTARVDEQLSEQQTAMASSPAMPKQIDPRLRQNDGSTNTKSKNPEDTGAGKMLQQNQKADTAGRDKPTVADTSQPGPVTPSPSSKDSLTRNPTDSSLTDSAASSRGADSGQKAQIESIFQSVEQKANKDSVGSIPKEQVDTKSSTAPAATKDTLPKLPQKAASDDSLLENPSDKQVGLDSARNNLAQTLQHKNTDSVEGATSFGALFSPYRKFSKNTSIESTTNLTILQQNVNYKTKADFTTEFQRTSEQGNDFLFDVIVAKLNTEVETMGVQLKYDSKQQTDSTSTFAKPLFDIVGKRTFLKADSSGRITAIDTSSLGQQVNTVLNGLSLSGSDYEVGGNFGLLLHKNIDSLIVGKSWQDSIIQGTNKRLTQYKIQNILNNELVVVISGNVEQTGEIASDGVVFKTHFTGTQQGKMHVDKMTGLIKNKELTLDLKGTVLYKDNSLPASAVSKIKEDISHD